MHHEVIDVRGVVEVVVPDNLRSAVSRACRYDPDKNPTYQELADHYGTVVLPARPRSPRDKAKVETAVQIVERWVLAPLRDHTFFSLAELNQEIRRRLEKLNDRPFQKLEGTRRSLFESLERPALRPLPATPYEYAEWRSAGVNIDYHVAIDDNDYSVPHQLLHQRVEVRLTAAVVEIFLKGRRIASHRRRRGRGEYATDMPHAHRAHAEWSPSRLITWAEKTGPTTAELVTTILATKPHPEQGYRACLGLMRLGKRHGAARLEAAAARALQLGAPSYRTVQNILASGVDQLPLLDDIPGAASLPIHPNIRGSAYYTGEEIVCSLTPPSTN